jgi:hypothetical protein
MSTFVTKSDLLIEGIICKTVDLLYKAILQIWNRHREQLLYAFPRESHGHDGFTCAMRFFNFFSFHEIFITKLIIAH